jgi:HSP20 family molecular chaperone IbpA
MKLIQYERPGLAWPTFGRLANLQDELDRLFEPSLTAWTPALDVREDADNFVICVELPGLKREDIEVSRRTARSSSPANEQSRKWKKASKSTGRSAITENSSAP